VQFAKSVMNRRSLPRKSATKVGKNNPTNIAMPPNSQNAASAITPSTLNLVEDYSQDRLMAA
jgi:hypothetical protein